MPTLKRQSVLVGLVVTTSLLVGSSGALAGGVEPITAAEVKDAKAKYLPPKELAAYPIPVFATDCGGKATDAEIGALRTALMLPIVRASETAVSSVVLDFCKDWPQELGVTTTYVDGGRDSVVMSKPSEDAFDYIWYVFLTQNGGRCPDAP
jgi:hypothetical protein